MARLALLAHVLAAFMFVAGYVATNVLTELARRARTPEERRAALAASGFFDRWFNAPGGTAVFLSGPIVLWAYGYAITEPWIIVSSGLFLLFPIVGGLYWAPLARRIEAALALGDDDTAAALLRARRSVLISRLENLVLVLIIALMVLRPEW